MPATVGRDTEWAAIEAFLDRTEAGPGALVIEGPAGIGKSTLWQDAVTAARSRGLVVLASRPAETERDLANVVLGDLFEGVRPDQLAALPTPRRRAFEAALLMREDPSVDVDPRALGVAIVTLLPALAGDRALLVAIDDDQWMDASSGTTLSFALRRLQGHRVSLLTSRRGGEPVAAALEDAFDPASVRHIAVGPLSVGALHAVVRDRLGQPLPRPAQLGLHEASGGNPFYALEMARAEGFDRAGDGFAGGALPQALPPSLDHLIEARIRTIDPETRRSLLLVAAHGRFPAAGLPGLALPAESIDRARAAGLIDEADGVFRFTHPLLASAIYRGSADGARRDAHRRLAAAVEDPVHRARHLALGADAPDADLAATIESAATQARNRGAATATAELAEHALRLTPAEKSPERDRRAALAARARSAAGDIGRARALASDLLAGAPRGSRRAKALVLAAELQTSSAAVPLLEEALSEAEGNPRLQAEIHGRLAEETYFGSVERASAEGHARASLRLAEELDDDALRASALTGLAIDGFNRGRVEALSQAERAYALASKVEDPKLLSKAGHAVGHVLTWMGHLERSRTWLERGLSDWSDRDEQARGTSLWYLALDELWAGRWRLASAYATEASEIARAYGDPFGDVSLALVSLHKGDFERARFLAERTLAETARQELHPIHAILGISELWKGDPEAALVELQRAEDAANGLGTLEPSKRHWRPDLVEALLQLGRIDDAATLTADSETAARRLGRERVLADSLRCRGLIAAARGDVEAAMALLEEAVIRHREVGDPFGAARAGLALGTTRRRAQQKRAAREALDAALTGFEELGAASWAARARSELARIGGRLRLSGLSPSELTVAQLVAEGRTNREIATTLFLAERTIASHLTNIYAKLGVRSRTELARHFAGKVPTS